MCYALPSDYTGSPSRIWKQFCCSTDKVRTVIYINKASRHIYITSLCSSIWVFRNYHIDKKRNEMWTAVEYTGIFEIQSLSPCLLFSNINHCKLTLYNHRDLRKKGTEPLLQASSRCAKLSATYSIGTYIYVKWRLFCPLLYKIIKNDGFLAFQYRISWTSVHRFSNSFFVYRWKDRL